MSELKMEKYNEEGGAGEREKGKRKERGRLFS